jgi:hypothetical protein
MLKLIKGWCVRKILFFDQYSRQYAEHPSTQVLTFRSTMYSQRTRYPRPILLHAIGITQASSSSSSLVLSRPLRIFRRKVLNLYENFFFKKRTPLSVRQKELGLLQYVYVKSRRRWPKKKVFFSTFLRLHNNSKNRIRYHTFNSTYTKVSRRWFIYSTLLVLRIGLDGGDTCFSYFLVCWDST